MIQRELLAINLAEPFLACAPKKRLNVLLLAVPGKRRLRVLRAITVAGFTGGRLRPRHELGALPVRDEFFRLFFVVFKALLSRHDGGLERRLLLLRHV